MIVSNDGDDQPWTLDTRQQLAEIAGEGKAAPMYANARCPDVAERQSPRLR